MFGVPASRIHWREEQSLCTQTRRPKAACALCVCRLIFRHYEGERKSERERERTEKSVYAYECKSLHGGLEVAQTNILSWGSSRTSYTVSHPDRWAICNVAFVYNTWVYFNQGVCAWALFPCVYLSCGRACAVMSLYLTKSLLNHSIVCHKYRTAQTITVDLCTAAHCIQFAVYTSIPDGFSCMYDGRAECGASGWASSESKKGERPYNLQFRT